MTLRVNRIKIKTVKRYLPNQKDPLTWADDLFINSYRETFDEWIVYPYLLQTMEQATIQCP